MPKKKATEVVEEQQPERVAVVPEEKTETAPAVEQESREETTPRTETASQADISVQLAQEVRHAVLLRRQEEDHSELIAKMEWRQIRRSVNNSRVYTGTVMGVEKTANSSEVALVAYNDHQILIPVQEMFLVPEDDPLLTSYDSLREMVRRMLGAEVEFMIRGVDEDSKLIVGSRRAAMEKKAEQFYFGEEPAIVEGRIAQARIVAVGRQWLRLEVFGVETYIRFSELDWQWFAESWDKYSVGDRILVRVNSIRGETPDALKISVDAKSVKENPDLERLSKISLQGRYLGKVVNVRKQSILLRLDYGVNAVAMGCLAGEIPGRGDVVCFVTTSVNHEWSYVTGLITRIIRRAE